jgi:hypothetical protein
MKLKLPLMIIILLLANLFNGASGINLLQSEEPNIITGFSVPRINGYIDGLDPNIDKLPQGKISEWDDALKLSGQLQSATLGVDVDTYIKYVSGSIFIAVSSKSENLIYNEIKSISLQVDQNNDGVVSDGDIRLTTIINQRAGNEVYLQILEDNIWIPLERSHLPNYQSEIISEDFLFVANPNQIGQIDVGPSSSHDRFANIEVSYNYEKMNFLMGKRVVESTSLGEIFIGLTVETVDETIFGYPGVPNVKSRDELQYRVEDYEKFHFDSTLPKNIFYDIGILNFEVTQALQTSSNERSLVKGKPSLARVFVSNPENTPIHVHVTIQAMVFGEHFFLDLGKIEGTFLAPRFVDRTVLSHSFNAELPSFWLHFDGLILKATVNPVNFIDPNMSNNEKVLALNLKNTHNMNIFTVLVNTGTRDHPKLPSTDRLEAHKSGLAALFPMEQPNYVSIPHSSLGPVYSLGKHLISHLSNLMDHFLLTILLSLALTGTSPYPIPDQLHGITSSGGGLSDPKWVGGHSYVGWSGWGSSGAYTMAHEVVHNLGPSPGWGNHIGGCGSDYGDPTWISLYGINDRSIQNLGWNPSTGLVPATYPDVMTYCKSEGTPVKWISDYRWEHLVTHLQNWEVGNPAGLVLQSLLEKLDKEKISLDEENTSKVRIVNGFLNEDGTGLILPSYKIDGYWDKDFENQSYLDPLAYLEILFSDESMQRIPLRGSFVDVEGHKHESIYFSEIIPEREDQVAVAMNIVDLSGDQMDSKILSEFDVTGGEFFGIPEINRSGNSIINYEVEYTRNIDPVWYQLQYSTDGNVWMNIGEPTMDNSIDMWFSDLPGSNNAKFRLLITDGMRTHILNSDTFHLTHLPPTVFIKNNDKWTVEEHFDDGSLVNYINRKMPLEITKGSLVSINAFGQNQFGATLPESAYNWEINGEDSSIVNLLNDQGSIFSAQFHQTGTFEIIVKVKDPDSGLIAEDSLEVIVNDTFYLDRSVWDEFQEDLQELRSIVTPRDQETEFFNLSSPILLLIPILLIFSKYKSLKLK